MRFSRIISFCLLLFPYCLSAQITEAEIKKRVEEIDSDSTLILREYDLVQTGDFTALDNGSMLYLWIDGSEVVKMREEFGPSYGRLSTIIYLFKGVPIKVIDVEENFERNDDGTLNYQILNEVYRESYLVFDWENDDVQIEKTGKRFMSEGSCSVYELAETTLERAKSMN